MDKKYIICVKCNGSGRDNQDMPMNRMVFNMPSPIESGICDKCNGSGVIEKEEKNG